MLFQQIIDIFPKQRPIPSKKTLRQKYYKKAQKTYKNHPKMPSKGRFLFSAMGHANYPFAISTN
ncbi:MAG: hypothetical protein Q4B68_11320, partial [Bacteroidales bacterium]|nr:hypothetical protein [Bacteroidales bacterium]